MVYQYKKKPLTNEEANQLSYSCRTGIEKLVIWTLFDTGIRISELVNLKKENIQWGRVRRVETWLLVNRIPEQN